jgi:hypothetical protein
MSIMHRIGNNVLSATMRLLYSIDVKDSTTGMWIMRKDSFVDRINLKSDGMTMTQEIKIVAFKFFKSIELEGRYYKRIGRKKLNSFRDGWNMLKFLFRYKNVMRFAVKQEIAKR